MGALRVSTGGGWVTPKSIRWGGSPVKAVLMAVNGAWVSVWSALTAAISGGGSDFNLGTQKTPLTRLMSGSGSVSAASGGQPISYQWTMVGSSGVTSPQFTSGTNGANVFIQGTVRLNQPGSISLQCVVSSGGASQTLGVTCYFNYYNNP